MKYAIVKRRNSTAPWEGPIEVDLLAQKGREIAIDTFAGGG